MERVYNFSAGPSQMPLEVLKQAQNDLLDYGGTGTSIMEMSHRSAAFEDVLASSKTNLKKIMEISDDYEILFLPGGATTQFSMIPMNLLKRGDTAAYAVTGRFANLAYKQACKWAKATIISDSSDKNYSYIPTICLNDIPKESKYLHITGNNTIYGTTYNQTPEHGDIPLVADWSSAILAKWIDINDYGLIYAGAQKNMGPAGLAVVIIKKDLIRDDVDDLVPTMYNYQTQVKSDSMYNTPPCWSIYMCGLMCKWVLDKGGVRAMEKINVEKSSLLYDFIDNSKIYKNNIEKKDRSITNVTFVLDNDEMTQDFLKLCKERGLINIKGHKSVGGCRASLYNGMPIEGVKKLIETMKEFELHV